MQPDILDMKVTIDAVNAAVVDNSISIQENRAAIVENKLAIQENTKRFDEQFDKLALLVTTNTQAIAQLREEMSTKQDIQTILDVLKNDE